MISGSRVVGATALLLSLTLSACSAPEAPAPTLDRDLAGYVFEPALELPNLDAEGNVRVDAVYQDVQRDIDPNSDVPMADRVGWVTVSVCAPEAKAGEAITELQASLIPEALLDENVRARAESGEFFAALECGEGWTRAPG